MELSTEDMRRLERLGYSRDEFSVSSDSTSCRLKNIDGHCFFYGPSSRTCRVYPYRPIGCRIYPVVYIVGEGIGVDDLCPMSSSVSDFDLKQKGRILLDHLNKIDMEQESK